MCIPREILCEFCKFGWSPLILELVELYKILLGKWFRHSLNRLSLSSLPLWETAPPARFYRMLGQTHMNGWSRVVASQIGGSTNYIFPFRLRVLQWSRHLFNYLKNKKTIIKRFLILLTWNWIYIDHRKITRLWS